MRTLLLLGAATLIAACASDSRRANAQDLGLVLTQPIIAPVPQLAQRLRPGISAADPARMLVIGDSLAEGFGALLVRQAVARELPIRVRNRGRSSTGLARADFYDWPENFEAMAAEMRPDIVVAHFGSNDMQTILAPEGRADYGTDAWEPAYREQIEKILEIAARYGILLYWIGPGPDGNSGLNRHLLRVNPLYEDEAEAAGATYFPITPFTAPPSGAFARNVEIDGRSVAMRTSDGSHFTGTGYRMVANRIFDALIDRFPELAPGPDEAPPTEVFAMALQ